MQCCLDGDIDDRFQRVRPSDFSLDVIWHKKLGLHETLTLKVPGSLLMPKKHPLVKETLSEFPIINYEQAQFYFRHYPKEYPKAPKPKPRDTQWADDPINGSFSKTSVWDKTVFLFRKVFRCLH